jgi:hypothetical protein
LSDAGKARLQALRRKDLANPCSAVGLFKVEPPWHGKSMIFADSTGWGQCPLFMRQGYRIIGSIPSSSTRNLSTYS